MSAINKLKSGTEAENANVKKINLNSLNNNKGRRQSISVTTAAKEKSTVDDTDDINKTETAQTYTESILDTENPDSMFMQHVKEKTEEASEWIAEQEEKEALEAEEASDISIDTTSDVEDYDDDEDGIMIDMTNPDEDLSNPVMMEADDSEGEVISFDLTSDNIEDVEEEDEVAYDLTDESDDIEDAEEEEVAEETPVVEPTIEENNEEPKKEQFTAPEIDIEVSQEETSSIDEKAGEETDNDITPINEDDDIEDDEMDRLRQITTERLKPASLNLDLSSFTIAKKAKVNANKVYKAYKSKISKWVLFNQKCTIMMKEFSGSELEMLMEYYTESRRSVDAMRRMFNMIYDHITSAKPANFETWLKITPYSDIDNYFFAIYIASFNGANYIPIDCGNDKCGKSYVTDNIGIMDSMVKFDSEEKKAEFAKIYQSETPPASKGIYTSEIVPLSYNVAIGFKEPSLWDRLEIDSIDENTQREFSSIIGLIPYIDNIYEIDMENHDLTPIGYKEFPENAARTRRSKIRKYNTIFGSLTIDEFAPVKAYVSALLDKTSRGVDYVIPETTCPECGHVNPEIPIGQGQVADMVFTRCQLGALVNTSIK